MTIDALEAAPVSEPAVPVEPGLPLGLEPVERRSAGRPVGSLSRRTRDLVRLLETAEGYRSPGLVLAQTSCQSVEQVLAEAGLPANEENRRWAVGLRLDAAKALLPYVHRRMPQAVEVAGQADVQVVITRAADGGEAVAAALGGSIRRVLEIQGVSEDGDDDL